MDDTLLVRSLERLRDLARDRDRLVLRDRPLRDAIGQRRSFDQLEDEDWLAIELLETVDRRDVGMAERGDDLRFTREAREAIGVDQMIGKDLQRDVAPELRVAGAIDLAHAARPERAGQLECADTRADLQRHRDVRIIRFPHAESAVAAGFPGVGRGRPAGSPPEGGHYVYGGQEGGHYATGRAAAGGSAKRAHPAQGR